VISNCLPISLQLLIARFFKKDIWGNIGGLFGFVILKNAI